MVNENEHSDQSGHSSNGGEESHGMGRATPEKKKIPGAVAGTQTPLEKKGSKNFGVDGFDEELTYPLHGNLNDLVADLCSKPASLGDYRNIRATLDPATPQQQRLDLGGAYTQPPSQNTLSFKHFLSNSTTLAAPSTTVTSLDPVFSASSTTPSSSASTSAASNPLQSSTGARPKVPQSASVSAVTSISSLLSGLSTAGAVDSSFSATRMKRSPRFSSFDSQASLAEYAGVGPELTRGGSTGGSGEPAPTPGFRLYLDAAQRKDNDFFTALGSVTANTTTTNSTDYERQYMSRSFSNYDLPPAASPRRRTGYAANKETRPTRASLHTTAAKMKLDLPIESASSTAASSSSRPVPGNSGDFPPAPTASALPDFVQDHWLDSWCTQEMNLNSPRNSPVSFLIEPEMQSSLTSARSSAGPNGNGGADESASSSKMLPDFLSDGPIIHSSQRLADVAAGLPSNSMGSPEEPGTMTTQLSRVRIENERLQLELDETRAALSQQMRRVSELEHTMQERERTDTVYNRAMSKNILMVEENLDKSKRRTAAAQSHVTKLKQQVMQLTAEVETLRYENEMLREEGAVGGCSVPNCDRPFPAAAAASASATTTNRTLPARPSRAQQISKELLKAASNAENNLRQLLTGVDNLRQMAADIESSELNLDLEGSPDVFSDFLDDCDDFDDYPGGPAL